MDINDLTLGNIARDVDQLSDALSAAAEHLALRDRSNAALHLADTVRPAPLTVRCQSAYTRAVGLASELRDLAERAREEDRAKAEFEAGTVDLRAVYDACKQFLERDSDDFEKDPSSYGPAVQALQSAVRPV